MLKVEDLVIDADATLGTNNLLADVVPWYEYTDGVRQDMPVGYKYKVACKKHGMEPLTVKIKGKQLIEVTDDIQVVKFNGLEMKLYIIEQKPTITASATGISLVNKVNA